MQKSQTPVRHLTGGFPPNSHVPLCKGITTWGMSGIWLALKFKLQQLL